MKRYNGHRICMGISLSCTFHMSIFGSRILCCTISMGSILYKYRDIYTFSGDSNYPEGVISTDMIVYHTGNVIWLSASILTSSCQMNVRFYPFDEQECKLKFAS